MSSAENSFKGYFNNRESNREPDSPFLDEAILLEEEAAITKSWESPSARNELESPFVHALELGYEVSFEREVEEVEEFVDELEFYEDEEETFADFTVDEKLEREEFDELDEEEFEEEGEEEYWSERNADEEEEMEAGEFDYFSDELEEEFDDEEEEAFANFAPDEEKLEGEEFYEFLDKLNEEEFDENYERESLAEFFVFESEEEDAQASNKLLNKQYEATSASDVRKVTFPSGESLSVVVGPDQPGEEYYDPNKSGNPLLDTSGPNRSKRLSKNFTVDELTKSGSKKFNKARIDLKLVQCLQLIRDYVGKPVKITSGYRSYLYNVETYRRRNKKPTVSQHLSGRAVDIKIAGMTGLEIAKAAINACGCNIGVGIGPNYAHIDVRGKWAKWTYYRDRVANARVLRAIANHHKQQCQGGSSSGTQVHLPTSTIDSSNNRVGSSSISAINVKRAVPLNRYYSQKLGWDKHYESIETFLGFTNHSPDEETFAEAVANWQQSQSLKVDGIIGASTWHHMEAAIDRAKPSVRPAINVKRAVQLNRYYSKKLQWDKYYDQIEPFLGFTNYSPNEETFAEAVADWQWQQQLKADGIIGATTWLRMQAAMGVQPAPDVSVDTKGTENRPPGPFGTLVLDPEPFGLPDKMRFSYQFTQKDVLWAARFIEGEAGGKSDADKLGILWAMFNRFGILTHRGSLWYAKGGHRTFHELLQKYSTTLQPELNSSKAAERAMQRKDFVPTGGFYPKTKIPKGQTKRHLRIQNMSWKELQKTGSALIAEKAMKGLLSNPGIGNASEFASTWILLKHNYKTKFKKRNGRSPTKKEWLRYSEKEWIPYTKSFKRNESKWIGQVEPFNHRGNTYFTKTKRIRGDSQKRRISDLPKGIVRIKPPNLGF